MIKCMNCGRDCDKLYDEELCEICHDKWLDNLIKDTDILKIMELNRYIEEDIGIGGT